MGVRFGGMEKLGSISCILVYLENGSKVWWDGETRVYIDASPTLHGKTKVYNCLNKVLKYLNILNIFLIFQKKNTSLASWGKISTLCLTPE